MTPQIIFGLNPLVPILSALLIARKIGPVEIPAAANQRSTATSSQVGTGAVRTWLPFADEIRDDPMLFSLLEVFYSESRYLRPSVARRENPNPILDNIIQ
jgi:hypothetical protein